MYFIKRQRPDSGLISGQTAAHRFLEYIGPTSCRVAHPPGGLCRQPIWGRYVKHTHISAKVVSEFGLQGLIVR